MRCLLASGRVQTAPGRMDADCVLVLSHCGFVHVFVTAAAAAAAAVAAVDAGAAVPDEHAGRGVGCTLDATIAVQAQW